MAKTNDRSRSGRKIGRDKVKCQRYKISGIRERNKIRRIRKHLKFHPNDACASDALGRIV